MKRILSLLIAVQMLLAVHAQDTPPYKLRTLQSKWATAENRRAEKGAGGIEGNGMKASPAIKDLKIGATDTLLYTRGPGMVRHLWCTLKPASPKEVCNIILRIYWDGNSVPSVEVPLHDFFGVAFGANTSITSQLLSIQPTQGYNCDIPMPFRKEALITVTNDSDKDLDWFFYQVDFTTGDKIKKNDGYFHAAFRQETPTQYGSDFTILSTSGAKGVFLGCVLGVSPLASGWWGEGEVKIFLDGDTSHPSLCGTGIEDYFGAAWGISPHCTPYRGAPLVEPKYTSLYRFHTTDPIYFQEEIRVTVQQMGLTHIDDARKKYGDSLIFRRMDHPRRSSESVFYLRSDNVSAVAYWYQYPMIKEREQLPSKQNRNKMLYIKSKSAAQSIAAPM